MPSAGQVAVETRRVARRSLRFDTPRQMWDDIDRIVAAERAGQLRRAGNWTVGQALGHLATWIDYGFDGYPPALSQPPWVIRVLLRLRKNRYIHRALPAGVKIPRVPGGTTAIEDIPTEDALAHLRRAWERLESGSPAAPNPIFGPLSHHEWRQLHLRHAELHLSFLNP